ncbi:MAG: hypothetical protein WCO56_10995 [Verrucomicrobiota bacterium]
MLRLTKISGWMVGLLFACLLPGTWAGERIEFSSTTTKTESLRPQAEDKKFDRLGKEKGIRQEFDLLDVIDTPQAESITPKRRMSKEEVEMASWKNSWIFVTPKSLNHQPTAEEVFNIQQMGPDGLPKNKLTTMDKYLLEKDPTALKKEGANETDTEEAQAKDTTERNADRQGAQRDSFTRYARSDEPHQEASRRSDSLLKDLFTPANRRDAERTSASSGSGENAAPGWTDEDPLLRGRPAGRVLAGDQAPEKINPDNQHRMAEFQQMLNGPGGASGRGDSLNLMGDSTRNPANPVAPRPYQMLDRNWHPNANLMPDQAMPSAARLPSAAETPSAFLQPPPVVQPPPKTEDRNSRYQPLVLPMPRRQY